MDIKNFVKQTFLENTRLANYDLTEGSNLYELFILPIVAVLEDKLSQDVIDTEADALDLGNYVNLTIDQMKRLAANHLVPDRFPNQTTGLISLHFSEPVVWEIEADTKLYSGDKEFRIKSLTETTLDPNGYDITEGLYVFGNVSVINLDGDVIAENTLGQIDGAPAELIKVTHVAMDNGLAAYTVAELYDLVRKSLYNRQLLNNGGISTIILESFNGVKSIEVVGKGDTRMTRDKLYNTLISNGEYVRESDFLGKLKSNIVANANKAYLLFLDAAGIVAEIDTGDGSEFLQPHYNSISVADGDLITFTTEDILNETFTQSSEVIGELEDIVCATEADKKYINVEDDYGFETGNVINIIDRDENISTRTGVIKEILEKQLAVISVTAADTIVISGITHADYIKEGLMFTYSGGNNDGREFVITVVSEGVTNTTLTVTGTVLADGAPVLNTIDFPVIELYNNIGAIYDIAGDGCYIENVLGEGFNIGNGWVKSEHGMPLGTYLNPREIMIVSGKAVFGRISTNYAGHMVQEIIARFGIGKFVDAVLKTVTVNFEGVVPNPVTGKIKSGATVLLPLR